MLGKKTIFIADDMDCSRELITEILSQNGFNVTSFPNGKELINHINKTKKVPDCILLDIEMPVMNGIDTAKGLRKINVLKKAPMIAVSGKIDDLTYKSLFQNGFYEAVKKPFITEILIKKVKDAITNSEHVSYKEFEYSMLLTLANLEELRDVSTSGHNKRLSLMAWEIAKELGKDKEYCNCIKKAVSLHDIGKMAIPESILNKETPLTKEEYELIKTHPQRGYEILDSLTKYGIDSLKMAQEISIKHHEKLDGSGYPLGIKHNNLPIYVRIATLLDMYDAYTMKRSYHKTRTHEEGISFLEKEVKDNKIDKDVLKAFKRTSNSISRIKNELL